LEIVLVVVLVLVLGFPSLGKNFATFSKPWKTTEQRTTDDPQISQISQIRKGEAFIGAICEICGSFSPLFPRGIGKERASPFVGLTPPAALGTIRRPRQQRGEGISA
jgi:hypothetical protein